MKVMIMAEENVMVMITMVEISSDWFNRDIVCVFNQGFGASLQYGHWSYGF